MKLLTCFCTLACLAMNSVVYAQNAPWHPEVGFGSPGDIRRDLGVGGESTILESASRAASRLVLQPSAVPQRQRRRGRLVTGLALLGIGGGLAFLANRLDPRGDSAMGFLTGAAGVGLAVTGGFMIARADSMVPVHIEKGAGW